MSNHDIDCAFSNSNFLLSLTHGTKYAHVTCAHKYSTRTKHAHVKYMKVQHCKIVTSTLKRQNNQYVVHFSSDKIYGSVFIPLFLKIVLFWKKCMYLNIWYIFMPKPATCKINYYIYFTINYTIEYNRQSLFL